MKTRPAPTASKQDVITTSVDTVWKPRPDVWSDTSRQTLLAFRISYSEILWRHKKKLLFVQFRGKCTEDYARALHRSNAPCTIVMTLRKLRTVMPSLKPPIEKEIRSGIVYKFTCSRCKACYVGFTRRHLKTRADEHRTKKSQPIAKHCKECKETPSVESFEILGSSSRGESSIGKGEKLWHREESP